MNTPRRSPDLPRCVLVPLCCLLLLGLPQASQAWDEAPCSHENRDAWHQFEKRLRAIEDPRDPEYVPHPFPSSVSEAWEDFLVYHRRAFAATTPSELPPTERRFFEAVDGGRAQVTGRRVVNWSPTRCGPDREQAFYFLLSVTDQNTGIEITRIAVSQSGLVHSLIHRPLESEWQSLPKPVMDLDATEQQAAEVLGSRPEDAQYVASTGTLRYDVLLLCVALHQGGNTYLRHPLRGLFRLDKARGLMTFPAGSTERSPQATAQELGAQGRFLISLNATSWMAAVPVQPATKPH